MLKLIKPDTQDAPQPKSKTAYGFSLMVALDDYVIDGLHEPNPQVWDALMPAFMAVITNRELAVKTNMKLTEFMDKSDVCPEPILLELRT